MMTPLPMMVMIMMMVIITVAGLWQRKFLKRDDIIFRFLPVNLVAAGSELIHGSSKSLC